MAPCINFPPSMCNYKIFEICLDRELALHVTMLVSSLVIIANKTTNS